MIYIANFNILQIPPTRMSLSTYLSLVPTWHSFFDAEAKIKKQHIINTNASMGTL